MSEIKREDELKPKLRPEQYIQDIIMATKGYYKLKDEKTIDLMKRVTGNICRHNKDDMPLYAVNKWMYRAFEWLIDNNIISKHHIEQYILGEHDSQKREKDERTQTEINFDFLYSSITMCYVKDIDLNLNEELATENDYIREIKRKYTQNYQKEYIEIFYNNELVKTFYGNNLDSFDLYKEAETWIDLQCINEYQFTNKTE